jgi:Icc-related predicted phosphoesterase
MRLGRGGAGATTRLFFAADIHGSETTFRKFVAAAGFYGVDALVFGGDLMGKLFVPIVRENGSLRARFGGEDHVLDDDGLSEFTALVDRSGTYWRVMERDEYEDAAADPFRQRALFQEEAIARLSRWLSLAEDRLAGTGVCLYVTGGNDDDPAVLDTLERHQGEAVIASEGRLIDLDGTHTMITVGWSTPTPWDTPREATEESLAEMIDRELVKIPDDSRCVFNLHCPPKDTPIDACLQLEDTSKLGPGELPRPDRTGGRFHYMGGGSLAVRQAIERHQPVVGLHGHIHESGGRFRLGRTQCFNPGSEYGQGQLQGWIVSLRDGRLTTYQHTSG